MTLAGGQGGGRIDGYLGWVLTGVAALTPLLIWLGPLGFAPLMGLAGLLCLPALTIRDEDRPVAVVLLLGLVWAAAAAVWSPFRPDDAESSVALKLSLQLPLYWACWCAAARVDSAGRRRALAVFAWGIAGVGVLFLIEALTGGLVYQSLRSAIGDPIRPDLARKNLAQGSFALALLWPVAAAGGVRAGQPAWLAAPAALGATALAYLFLSDAPVMALGLAGAVALLAWVFPRSAPNALGAIAAGFFLLTPAIVLGVRSLARGYGLTLEPPSSWAQRLTYWTNSVDLISQHPLRGWGLDASRAFSPYITLHPHNGPLQAWLELGALGAVSAALVWAFVLRRLSRSRSDLVAAAGLASGAVYLLFAAANFGLWQEWWLALGAMVCVIVGLAAGQVSAPGSGQSRRSAAKSSTSGAVSG